MSLTIDQLLQCEERLQAEIAERQCLLAAVNVLKGYAEKGNTLQAVELGILGKVLLGDNTPGTLLLESTAEKPAGSAPAPAPALPKPKPYIHPELERVSRYPVQHGQDIRVVCWAIRRMTDDFTLNDLAKLLKQEGCNMAHAKISVVLTRLKSRGEIQEIRRGGGRTAALFAKPMVPVAEMNGSVTETSSIEAQPEAAAA